MSEFHGVYSLGLLFLLLKFHLEPQIPAKSHIKMRLIISLFSFWASYPAESEALEV